MKKWIFLVAVQAITFAVPYFAQADSLQEAYYEGFFWGKEKAAEHAKDSSQLRQSAQHICGYNFRSPDTPEILSWIEGCVDGYANPNGR